MIETKKYVRKPLPAVDAVQVTEDNMLEVAAWCKSPIMNFLDDNQPDYIRVDVYLPLNDRQTKAFVGDWVLHYDRGFKVYTDNAFQNHFVPEEFDFNEVVYSTGDVKAMKQYMEIRENHEATEALIEAQQKLGDYGV